MLELLKLIDYFIIFKEPQKRVATTYNSVYFSMHRREFMSYLCENLQLFNLLRYDLADRRRNPLGSLKV